MMPKKITTLSTDGLEAYIADCTRLRDSYDGKSGALWDVWETHRQQAVAQRQDQAGYTDAQLNAISDLTAGGGTLLATLIKREGEDLVNSLIEAEVVEVFLRRGRENVRMARTYLGRAASALVSDSWDALL